MEQLNRVELRGVVGSVRESEVGNMILVKLTVATNFMYKDNEGNVVIETTWHQVEKFFHSSPGVQKGDNVWIVGRLKCQRYMRADGVDVNGRYIVANSIKKIDEQLTFEV